MQIARGRAKNKNAKKNTNIKEKLGRKELWEKLNIAKTVVL